MEIASAWEDRPRIIGITLLRQQVYLYRKSILSHFSDPIKRPLCRAALADIQQLEALDENNPGMLFYTPQEESSNSNFVKLKLFHKNEQIYLSDVMPMLENLGLRVIGEAPQEVTS